MPSVYQDPRCLTSTYSSFLFCEMLRCDMSGHQVLGTDTMIALSICTTVWHNLSPCTQGEVLRTRVNGVRGLLLRIWFSSGFRNILVFAVCSPTRTFLVAFLYLLLRGLRPYSVSQDPVHRCLARLALHLIYAQQQTSTNLERFPLSPRLHKHYR